MEARGIRPQFVDGRRVTTPEVLDVVIASLRSVNEEVCRTIGGNAVALHGDEIGLRAEPVPELGLVGDPMPSAPPEVRAALAQGLVPVVSPLAAGPLNVNADEAAAALAVGLGADRIEFVSDVAGVLLDGVVTERLDVTTAERMLSEARFEGGIVPKLLAAVHATRSGVHASIGSTEVVA
jgi:acetylglutamate kinase